MANEKRIEPVAAVMEVEPYYLSTGSEIQTFEAAYAYLKQLEKATEPQ